MYLVVYDITDKKRLNKIARIMDKYGTRVQKSVFECELTKDKLLQLRADIEKKLKPDTDSVRFYFVCDACIGKAEVDGVGTIPEKSDFIIV